MVNGGQSGGGTPLSAKGNPIKGIRVMKRHSQSDGRRLSAGFTLVELLVVITIIGILAGLVTAAAVVAVRRAKEAAIYVELTQLDMACKAYKEKFGEYPPDFAGVNSGDATLKAAAQSAVLRHFAKAFPRYAPGSWATLQTDVLNGWNLDIDNLTPAGALAFFLGGKPDWLVESSGDAVLPGAGSNKVVSTRPIRGFLGFSANPAAPFDSSASRIKPFYDFDINSIGCTSSGGTVTEIAYWPKVQAVTAKNSGLIVYFRAENGNYTVDGNIPNGNASTSTNIKSRSQVVWPAIDTRLSTFPGMGTPTITWTNPQSVQIFASGLNLRYGTPVDAAGGTPFYGLRYPVGTNYATDTFDDITNFYGGRLESAMP